MGCVSTSSLGTVHGHTEREHALKMLRRLRRRAFQPRTLGADKGYDTRDFVHAIRQRSITRTLRLGPTSASAYNLVRMTRSLAVS